MKFITYDTGRHILFLWQSLWLLIQLVEHFDGISLENNYPRVSAPTSLIAPVLVITATATHPSHTRTAWHTSLTNCQVGAYIGNLWCYIEELVCRYPLNGDNKKTAVVVRRIFLI